MGCMSENSKKETPGRSAKRYKESALVIYDCTSRTFTYPPKIKEWIGMEPDGRPLWKLLGEERICDDRTAEEFREMLERIACADSPQVYFTEYCLWDRQGNCQWYRVGFVCAAPGESVNITFTDIESEVFDEDHLKRMLETDPLTGLMNRDTFCREVERLEIPDEAIANGEYAMVFFDIVHFKAINDIFGTAEGDRLLKYIADVVIESEQEGDLVCRFGSDRFTIFTHTVGDALEERIENILEHIEAYDLPIVIMCSMGVYVTEQKRLSAELMIDRAILAQAVIKGSYTQRYSYYKEELRNAMLTEQEITGMMENAMTNKHFIIYYQPQYNHSTGMLVGAEALVRWKHPERGLISPGIFIPIFEKNGFITRLDMYVFEEVCAFLQRCMRGKLPMIPVSTNFSRHDIFQPDFVKRLEEIRTRYEIPVQYLRVEITESSIRGNSRMTNEVIAELHAHGYVVEMDDFGSGYSSLNVLKDIEMDIVKLDMLFLSEETTGNRGGTILSSIVRMLKWLEMPMIAEGVETVEQADFLRSIGCEVIQGYLYAKPLPEEEYGALVEHSSVGTIFPQKTLMDNFNAGDFWDPNSLETLIFNQYVGGAALFSYTHGELEILRVNKKYLQEIGMNQSEKDVIESDPFAVFDEENRRIYTDMLERAIETMEEQECETWRRFSAPGCGAEYICIRTSARLIGRNGDNYLFYAMIRNIKAEKESRAASLDKERRFQAASEQVNIYYWEYTVATKEMHPCFRCMRDLGLPVLMKNYPDSAIAMGVFPPEVAEQYRDWHRQIDSGVAKLEGILPLTMARVPFKVRYTTEFDESGRPIKAYGSAVPVA